MTTSRGAVPVTILSGFLGAGKTTLLKRILDDPQGVRYGVLINDFGAVNIDAELVVESTAEQVTLQNGCVCCTIRDDLVGAIEKLLDSRERPDRLVVEASGVSRPLPIADALEAEALQGRVALDGIFCLVDGANFRDLDFESTELALDQAAGADIVVLNKADLATGEELAAIEETLSGPLPRLRLIRTSHGDLPRELLFGARAPGDTAAPHGHAHDHDHDHCDDHAHHDHGEVFEGWSWQSGEAIDERAFRAAIRSLPTSLLRAKGVFRAASDGGRVVFHLVGKRFEIVREDGPAPTTSSLVAIGRRGSFDPRALTALLDGCAAEG